MSDFFIPNQKNDYWNQYENKNNPNQVQNTQTDYWQKQSEKTLEQKQIQLENRERYGVNVPDEYYDVFNKIISQAPTPEEAQEEAYKIGSAIKYSQMMNMSLEDAYKNVDALNEAQFPDLQNQKSRFEALSDMLILGANNVKLGELGQKLKKAHAENDTELAQSLMAEIDAYNKENVLLQDNAPRTWVMKALEAGAQSLPFTGAVAGAGIIGNFINPIAGAGASFAASSYLSGGQEYIDMIANGASPKTARIVSNISGGIQGLIEADLGITSGIVKGSARLLGKQALKEVTEESAKKGLEEIGRNVFKRFHFGAGKKVLINYLEQYGKNVLGEGTEEFLQEITSIVSQEVAASLDGYDIPDDDLKHIVKQTTEAFRGGILGALSMGFIPAGINAAADIKDYKFIKDTAEVLQSEEMFKKVAKDSPVFEGMSDKQKAETIHEIWQKAQDRVEEAANLEAQNIAEGLDAGEGSEERTITTDENGNVINEEVNPVVRDEKGKLYTQGEEYKDDNGKVTGGIYLAGDVNKTEKNRYGYIKYSQDENGDITITDFKMNKDREGLRGELFDEFAREHPDVKIDWNAIGSDMQEAKERLIDANPSGKKNGLSYYSTNELDNVQARKQVASEIRKNIHNVKRNADGSYTRTELSNKQVAAAVTLIESAARRMNMSLNDYVSKTFGSQIFGSREEFEQATLAQGENVNTKAGGMTQGVAQANWRQVGQQVKAVIYAGENADFSTWAHEMAHVFQNQLDGDLKTEAENAFNVVGGDWVNSTYTFADGRTMSSAEAFAYGFQDWLETGKAESEQMKNIFQKFAEFIADAYNRLRKHLDFTPEIESVFNKLLDGDDTIMSKALKAAQEEEGEYRANLKRQAEEKEAQKKAEAEESKRQAEAEREEVSEGTDFEEAEKEISPEEAEAQLQEGENEISENDNSIDNALENTNLDPEKKNQIAEVLKDETSTLVAKAEAITEAASSVYDEEDEIPDMLFQAMKNQAEQTEAERQMEAVRKQYEGTDTWMKAPNGQPTKLTEKQWLQVRTPNFKRWFGNWEKAVQIDRLKNNVVTTIKKGVIKSDANTKIIEAAKNWIKNNVTSPVLTSIGDVVLDERTIQNSMSHGFGAEKIDAIQAIPEILQHGEYLGEYADVNGATIDNHYFAGKVKIGDDEKIVFCRVKVAEGTEKRFYVHEVFSEEQINNGSLFKTGTAENGKKLGSEPLYLSILRDFFDVNKNDYSKVIDENGEPLVVYHGSSQWFQVFNEGKTNKASNVNTPDNTIFTNDNKEIASSFQNYYGGKVTDVILDENSPLHRKYDWGVYRAGGVYSLFMNLRNPKVLDYKGQTWKADGMNINDEVAKAMQEGYDGFIAKNIIDVGFTDVTPPASNDYIAFNNTDVKSATDNNGNFDANNPNILFQIAGEIGAQNFDDAETQEGVSRMQNLAIAKQMETDGKDAKAIRLATGWEKGSDGKWKYEISDGTLKNDVKRNVIHTYKLSDVLQADELFRAYPELKKLEINFRQLSNRVLGFYEPTYNFIALDKKYEEELFNEDETTEIIEDDATGEEEIIKEENRGRKELLSTLLHEIQHAIQQIEGFAKGGSVGMFAADEQAANPLTAPQQALLKDMQAYMDSKDSMRPDYTIKEYLKNMLDWNPIYSDDYEAEIRTSTPEELENWYNEHKAKYDKWEEERKNEKTPLQKYESLAGEVEARNVQTRRNFTSEERREALLAATEDVARDDQIMLFQQVYHGSGADFDKFDTKNFGLSGEGSMSFGYGTYLTDNEEIARDYARRQGKTVITLDGKEWHPNEDKLQEKLLYEDLKAGKSLEEIKKWAESIKHPDRKSLLLDTIKELEEKGFKVEYSNRNLYTVEIPDDGYLEWDRLYKNEEIPAIAKALRTEIEKDYSYGDAFIEWDYLEELENHAYTMSGANLLNNIKSIFYGNEKEKKASKYLNRIGYAGIKYPAGTIHGNGNGAYNYVIFNDEDAKIIDHLFFQTQAELMEEAKTFESWQEFMDFCEATHVGIDTVSPIPSDSDAQWYQSFWEQAKGLQTEQEKNEQTVSDKLEKEGNLPTAIDALFASTIRNNPELVDAFLARVAEIDAIDLNSPEWLQVENEEGAREREEIDELKDFISITLSDYNWQSAIRRVQGRHDITEGMRKKLIGEMLDNFKLRDFRALYSKVMGNERFEVEEEDTIASQLQKKLSKYEKRYHDILKPNEDIARVSPERRKNIAEQMTNRDIAAKIKNGSLKLDDELDNYIKSLDKQINEKQKQLDSLEAETKADYQRIADDERRKLLKLHEELLFARGKVNKSNAEINRKINKGLKITEKYQKQSQNLNADYDEIFRKYSDLKNSMQINAEVQAALERQEQVAGLREDLNSKQKEKSHAAEIKKMRIQLVKRAMRRVPFNRIDFENAKTVIAIQRMLEPNLLGGVNRFIGIDNTFLRGVISQIVTDSDYKEKILSYLSKNSRSSQAFVDFKKKLEELKTIKDFDSWTAKERKAAIRYLPKENWVRDLNLKQLAEEREESIDLDIGTEEYSRPVYDEKTGEQKTYTDKDGIEHNVTETAFRLKYSDEIGRMVQDAVGADMFDRIVNKPFGEWTTEELEELAQRIDELYTEGRDLKAAKDEARRREADRIRQKVENAIKDTGIVINDDDTPEEKKRKQKKINKVLGKNRDLKGTEAGKTKGFKAKLLHLVNSYSDMNVLRFARMLDGKNEGENYRMLYRREDDCFNAKQRSIFSRTSKINKVMKDNKITEGDLAKSIKVDSLGTEFTVDELLFFLAADKDYAEDEVKLAKGFMGLDANDDYAATSRNAVMFGNMMSDTMSQEEKERYDRMDKEMEDAIKNDTLSTEQKQLLTIGQLDKKPGTSAYIATCHAKWLACLSAANTFLSDHPEYKALMEAIEEDYAEQYERLNEVSINEFNSPVHRVKAYVPLVRRESNGDTNVNQVKEDLLGAYGAESGKQGVNKGMTQRRVTMNPLHQKPVQTGLFNTWSGSIERTEHFIAYSPYVRQLNAVYKSRDAAYTRRFIESRYGKDAIKYLDDYINEVANPNAEKVRERGAEWLHVLRGKTAPAYLGWKFSGVIKQGLTSPWPYMQFVNPAEYAAAAFECCKKGTYDDIKAKSAFMNSRVMDPINDLVDEMSEQAKNKFDRGWSKFTKIGMQGLEWIDWTCVAPGWLACYKKKYNLLQKANNARYEAKLAELKEKNSYVEVNSSEWMTAEQIEAEAQKELYEDIEMEAVQYADDCTRACQPSSRLTDLAPMFKNASETKKAFLQFQTSLNVIWQNIRYDIPYAVKQKEFKRIVGTICGYVFAGIFMNSVMDGVRGDDDDDETQTLRNLIYYSTTQFTDAIPIMGSEITNTMDQFITGKRGFAQSGTDMTPSATKLLSVMTKVQKGDWKKAASLTAEGIGLFMGAPVSGTKEIYKLLGKPFTEGDVNIKRGVGDVYGLAGDILGEE